MIDEKYMKRAIELAKNGTGFVNPNPLVGAVIERDGKILAEGYHARYGELHAERAAIAALKESAKDATIYVTLEPCCHYGKQPPCTEAIIEAGISTVVIGSRDPNPLVAGKGVQVLREAGIQVIEDYMRKECDSLNDVFFHFITRKTPYVVAKYAMTMDGKIATKTGASKWITSEKSRARVQKMRSEYMGIMVGIGTVFADDPLLSVRDETLRSPIRIICDSNMRLPLDSQIVKTAKQYPTILAYANENTEKKEKLIDAGIELIKTDRTEKNEIDLCKLMQLLGERKIDSILLEGGGTLNESAFATGIIQKAYVFIAPKIFGGAQAKSPVAGIGVDTPDEAYQMALHDMEQIGDDVVLTYKRKEDTSKNDR